MVKGVWEEMNGFLTLIVFFMSCGYCCSVSLPHGAVDLSVVCDCDIPGHTYLLVPYLVLI